MYLRMDSYRVGVNHQAAGLLYCHENDLIVGDLRPAKILLENGWLKIGSLSHAIRINATDGKESGPMAEIPEGGVMYLAPELTRRGAAARTAASDLWALGCILYEMFAGTPPFVSDKLGDLYYQITEHPLPLEPLAGASADFIDVVSQLLMKDPLDRPKWHVLVEHPYWEGGLPEPKPMPAVEAHTATTNAQTILNETLKQSISAPESDGSFGDPDSLGDVDGFSLDSVTAKVERAMTAPADSSVISRSHVRHPVGLRPQKSNGDFGGSRGSRLPLPVTRGTELQSNATGISKGSAGQRPATEPLRNANVKSTLIDMQQTVTLSGRSPLDAKVISAPVILLTT